MPKSGNASQAKAGQAVKCQTALVTRIALFLKLLSKENFQKLLQETTGADIDSEGELLKLMLTRGYISPKDAPGLKKTCLSFARAQNDTRFGSLCIEFGFLTQSNLDLALEEQKSLGDFGRTIFLGDLLVEAGMISEQQQKLILQKQKMDLDFQENTPQSTLREIREKGLVLYITQDGLRVHGLKTKGFTGRMTLADLKDFLEDHGIIYGLANDFQLEKFLTDDAYKTTRFELAKGLEPLAGTDAQIFYLFEQNYLSAGRMGDDGTMDYKTRGQIPIATAGDILAEKIPAKEGRDGVDVFGDVVTAIPPADMDILCGKGISLSENKLQAYADIDGYPKLSMDGTLSVSDAHVIKGDVDFTTGHVRFTKNVFITGTIKSGFEVEALDVVARAVDGGIIRAKGDVSVALGITNAQVEAEGSVSASYVHRSSIGALGDVDIAQEVVESTISLEGTFEMPRGKMYASTISARGGAKIYHIGSIKTVPSNIEVGTSPYLKRALRTVNHEIEKAQNRLEAKLTEKEAVYSRISEIEKELRRIGEMAAPRTETSEDPPEEATKTALKAEQLSLEKQLQSNGRDLARLHQIVKNKVARKFDLQHKASATPPKPILDVRGKVLAGTMVKGLHSNTAISKDLARVRIMEMSSTGDSKRKGRIWEMVVTRL